MADPPSGARPAETLVRCKGVGMRVQISGKAGRLMLALGLAVVAAIGAGAYAFRQPILALLWPEVPLAAGGVDGPAPSGPANRLLDASFFKLAVTEWSLPLDSGFPKIAMAGARLLVATSAGELFFADTSEPFVPPNEDEPSPEIRPAQLDRLALRVPTDMAAFAAADIPKFFGFGVGDIHVEQRADGRQDLYASFGKVVGDNCMVLRVAVAEGFDRPGAQWRTLFDSQPCFPIAHPADRIAGRMRIRDGQLYVTVGFNAIDDDYFARGRPAEENPQRDDNSYGKVIRIDLASGAATIVSKGHRNPQGLYIDPQGRILETEHGPRGGDELNLIVEGHNYGWPVVTFGTQYGHHDWKLAPSQNSHAGYDKPIFAWVPSIATSEIVGLEDAGFGPWRGDLLVASLIAERLYRLHLDGDRVLVSEPIKIGHRLRDLVVDGATIYLATDDARIVRIEPREEDPG